VERDDRFHSFPLCVGTPTYNGFRPDSQGYRLRHCSYYLSTMQPLARYLSPWVGRPEPRQPVCVLVTLYGCLFHICYHLPRDSGYGSPRNPEVRARGWICGMPIDTYANWHLALKSCSITDNTVIHQISRQWLCPHWQ
jgi:hypothetical protein